MGGGKAGRTAFMPDMGRDIFDPALVVHYVETRRGDPVTEPFPPRVEAAVAHVEKREEALSVRRRSAPAPGPLTRLTSKVKRLLKVLSPV